MKIVVFGLTITSSWGNGHATTYRSLLKALAGRGHTIHFLEKDVEWYRNNRDAFDTSFCNVHLYEDWEASEAALIALWRDADVVVVGSYVADAVAITGSVRAACGCPVLFYDIDTPVTLAGLREHGRVAYLDATVIPEYSAYLSFTGGPVLGELEERFGARRAVPFFCSVDPNLYRATAMRVEFQCDLSYLGTYAADRQSKLERLMHGAAAMLPTQRFLVAGPQYPPGAEWPANVARLTHVPPGDHPAFYSSSRFTLNLTRADMVAVGYSPSVRLFEASACGAAILSDRWAGLDEFLTPGEEILLPESAEDVARILSDLPDDERVRMGQRARERILSEHTAAHRAAQFETIVAACR